MIVETIIQKATIQTLFWACMEKLHKESLHEYHAITKRVTVYYSRSILFDAMNKIAPPGFYFGVHPDDSKKYGFWLIHPKKLTVNEILGNLTGYLIHNKGEKKAEELIKTLEHYIWLFHHAQ